MKNYYLRTIYNSVLLAGCLILLVAIPLNAQSTKGKLSQDLVRLGSPQTAASTGIIINPDIYQIQNGKVLIEAVAQGDPQALLIELEGIGLTEGLQHGGLCSGMLPLTSLESLQSLPSLKLARPAYKPIHNVGLVTSQGDAAQQSNVARNRFGVDGTGVKIGVLSDSYDNLMGAASGIASGDLPGYGNPNGYTTTVDVLEDFAGGGTDEGRGMMEIIHDVAPGAELAFHTAFNGQVDFAIGILELAAAGSDIIVDDVVYLAEPYFQDGIIAQAADIVTDAGVAYFSSAGNRSRASYQARFTRGKTTQVTDLSLGLLGNYMMHDFDAGPGMDIFQEILVPTNGTLTIAFQWADPFASNCVGCPGAQTDMDMFLSLVEDESQVLFSSISANINGDPFEFISVFNSGADASVYLSFGKWLDTATPTPNPSLIKYINFGSLSTPLEHDTQSSTTAGHSNSTGAIATGAVRYDATPAYGVNPPVIEFFSSAGGTPILFDVFGNRVSPQYREKPEISAPQGVNTTFFGFDYEGDSFPNFFGTSASAPSAAAVAALMQEVSGNNLGPHRVENILQTTAIDMDDPFTEGFDTGFDYGTGYGMINAKRAVQVAARTSGAATTNISLSMFPNPANDVVSLDFNTKKTMSVTMEIHDHIGVAIQSQSLQLPQGAHTQQLDLAAMGMPKGLYYLKLKQQDGTEQVFRLVKE